MARCVPAVLLLLLMAAAAVPAAEKAPASGAAPAPAPTPPTAPVTAPSVPVPVLAFESTNLDLGALPEGEDAVGTFVVRNTGKAELKLLQVKPG
jgi:hypothetical protein